MFSKQITIKPASDCDFQSISEISKQTYIETYFDFFEQEIFEAYLEEKFNPLQIRKELNNNNIIYLIACCEGEIIGYAKLKNQSSPDTIDWKNSMEIERLYVLKEFQSLKIGSTLIQKCIEKATNLNCSNIWLAVWENNPKAINFYKKMEFEINGTINFNLGKKTLNDFLMIKKLQ